MSFLQSVVGIRFGHVTVVQTCALPISSMVAVPVLWLNVRWSSVLPPPEPLAPKLSPPLALVAPRSEERRVGKEGRPRTSTILDKVSVAAVMDKLGAGTAVAVRTSRTPP